MSMLISGAELKQQKARNRLIDARNYRRAWAAVTVQAGVITAGMFDITSRLSHHGEINSLPLGGLAIASLVGVVATGGSFTQILDGCMLVDSRKSDLRRAQYDVAQVEMDRAIQPELDLAT